MSARNRQWARTGYFASAQASDSTPAPIVPPAPPDAALDYVPWYDHATGEHKRRRRLCDDCKAGFHPASTHGPLGCLRTVSKAPADHVCKCDHPVTVN